MTQEAKNCLAKLEALWHSDGIMINHTKAEIDSIIQKLQAIASSPGLKEAIDHILELNSKGADFYK